MSAPLILVSNDDGVRAPGIAVLADIAAEFGEVIVVAPSQEQSGASHAITFRTHLRADPIQEGWFAVSGTPVDSVYLGALHLCSKTPSLVLSGINDGYNLGMDVHYSGTVGAAREACLRGIHALAISVDRGSDPKVASCALRKIIPELLALGSQESGQRDVPQLLNLNVPKVPHSQEIQVTRLGQRKYIDQVQQRVDLDGRPYYWIGGPPATQAEEAGSDTAAVRDGLISLTPLTVEATSPRIERWSNRFRSK